MAQDDREFDDPLDWPARGLAPWARRTLFAAAEAILADETEAGDLVAGNEAFCERGVRAVDHSVGRASTDVQRGFWVLCFALEILPLFLVGTFSRMSKLPLEGRVRYFEALETSKIGLLTMLFVAIKVPLCIPAFEEPPELFETGFDRPSTSARRRLEVAR